MVLRATNQLVEILAPGDDGTLRVTSQIIEVLAMPAADLEQVLENELSFTTECVTSGSTFEKALGNEISFTTVAYGITGVVSSENEIAFTSTSDGLLSGRFIESLEHEITFEGLPLYIGPKSVSVSTTIEFEDYARIPDTYELDASSTLAFTQLIGRYGSIHYSLSSSLTFAQIADLTEKDREASNEIEFTTLASADYIKVLGNILELEDTAVKGLTVVDIQHPLTFVHDARCNPRNFSIDQQISFGQAPRNSVISIHVDNELEFDTDITVIQPWSVWAESVLQVTTIEEYDEDGNPILIITGLQDAAAVEKALGRSITSPVWFSQDGKKVLIKVGAVDIEAEDTLAFSSSVPECIYLDANNIIEFIDYVDNRHEFPVSLLEIESDVAYNISYAPRLASSTLNLVSSFFGEKEDISLCEYTPILGSTNDPDAPQQYLKNVPIIDSNASGVTLFYPWVSPTTTVNLRGPDLGNRTRLEFQRIKRETRGGTLIVWADPMWPKNEHLVLSFSGLSETEGQAVLDFIYLTLGKEIGIVDWEGNTQRAITITPNEPLVRNSRGNLSINLEFEISRAVLRGRSSNEIDFTQETSRQFVYNRSIMSEIEYTPSADPEII